MVAKWFNREVLSWGTLPCGRGSTEQYSVGWHILLTDHWQLYPQLVCMYMYIYIHISINQYIQYIFLCALCIHFKKVIAKRLNRDKLSLAKRLNRVGVYSNTHPHAHTHTHIYIYIHIYISFALHHHCSIITYMHRPCTRRGLSPGGGMFDT